MKDIKTKSITSPKVKNTPKVADHSKNTVKDVKSVMRDTLIKQAAEVKRSTDRQEQPQRAEVEATENVENAAHSAAETVYHKGERVLQNNIQKGRQQKPVRTASEPPAATMPKAALPPPKTPDTPPVQNHPENIPKEKAVAQAKTKAAVKTKENYIQSHSAETSAADTPHAVKVKTKDNYIQSHSEKPFSKSGVKQHTPVLKEKQDTQTLSKEPPKQARKEYVQNKLKTKAEFERVQAKETMDTPSVSDIGKQDILPKDKRFLPTEKADAPASVSEPKPMVKTKESYMRSLRQERAEPIKSPYQAASSPKEKVQTVSRSRSNKNMAVKTKSRLIEKLNKTMKRGNSYQSGKTARKRAVKAKKATAKTQKEVTKKAAKQAAKQAKIATQKAAQAAKAAAKVATRVAVKVAQIVAAAVTKLVSALVAMGGWAVLVVVLIIIIIVAAIAASPFGIFISDEAADADSIPVSSIIAECNMELAAQLDSIENNTPHNKVIMDGEQADWTLVLSLFAVQVAGVDDETVQDVVVIDQAKKDKLKAVFWDIHSLSSRIETTQSGEETETVLYITTNAKTKDEMIAQYQFTEKQIEALETLLANADGLIGATQSLAISDGTAKGVIDALPDTLPAKRKAVVKAACSLVGKVNYFWGGKSSAIGWDSRWGKMALVTAEGSKSSGSMRPFGLDCSGFVTWSFINSGFSASQIGHGTKGQIAICSRIAWSAAQPGDLAFLSDLSHVGIVAGKDENGNILVIHCVSGANNVVITSNSIFGFAAKPSCY